MIGPAVILAGFVCVVVGACLLVTPAVVLIAAGVVLVVVGLFVDLDRAKEPKRAQRDSTSPT